MIPQRQHQQVPRILKSMNDKKNRWRHMIVLFWLALDMNNALCGRHLGRFLYGLLCGLSTIKKLLAGCTFLDCLKGQAGLTIISAMVTMTTTKELLVDADGRTSPNVVYRDIIF